MNNKIYKSKAMVLDNDGHLVLLRIRRFSKTPRLKLIVSFIGTFIHSVQILQKTARTHNKNNKTKPKL